MSMTDSSSRSSRSPGLPRRTRCRRRRARARTRRHRCRARPDRPRGGRASSRAWRLPRVAERVGADHQPEPHPRRQRRRARPARSSPRRSAAPTARRWPSGGPTSRPSPSPPSSAARAASRKPGQSVCCDQSWSPKRVIRRPGGRGRRSARNRKLIRSWRSNRSRDRAARPPPGSSRVVAAGHPGDVGLGGRPVGDRPDRAGQPDPAVAVRARR